MHPFYRIALFLLPLIMSFDAFSDDEIIPSVNGLMTNTGKFMSGAGPMSACQAIKGADPHIRESRRDCPVYVSESGPYSYTCSAEFYTEPEDQPAYCRVPVAGSMVFGGSSRGVTCPEHYRPVKVGNGKVVRANYFGYTPADNGRGFYEGASSDTQCARCLAPFAWDETTGACITECPENQKFDPTMGMCTEKAGWLEKKLTCEMAGNPVYAKTGEKQQTEEPDYLGGGAFPIVFSRNYKSYRAPAASKRNGMAIGNTPKTQYIQSASYGEIRKNLGWNIASSQVTEISGTQQWRHSFMATIEQLSDSTGNVVVVRPDGETRYFSLNGNGFYIPKNENRDKLIAFSEGDDDAYWVYHTPDNYREVFDSDGKLRKIYNRQGHIQTLEYDNQNRLIRVSVNEQRSIHFEYDELNRITTLIDPAGQKIEYNYDGIGNLTSVTFPDNDADTANNPTITYHYDDPDNPLALTGKSDARGNLVASWLYDDQGRVIRSSHVENNNTTHFEYGPDKVVITKDNGYERTLNYDQGQLISVVGDTCASDGTKGTTQFVYDSAGEISDTIAADGTQTQYRGYSNGMPNEIHEGYKNGRATLGKTTYQWHDDFNLPVRISDLNSWYRVSDFKYGENGRLEQKSITASGETRTTRYTYNPEGLLASIDGPRDDVSDVTLFSYNLNGDLATITNALGHVTRFNSYDPHGRITEVEDPNGLVYSYQYDVRGRLVKLSYGDRTFTYGYDANGNLIQTNDENRLLTYGYDSDNRLVSVADGRGNSLNFTLDAYGNITQSTINDDTGALTYSVTQTFDQLNRLETITTADNNTTRNEYDVMGNLVKIINPLQETTKHVMDGLQRLTATTDALNGEISFGYDSLRNLSSVTDQNNKVTSYTHNRFDEVIRISSPDTGSTHYTYDKAGNVLTKKDARNITVSYRYDALNRITDIEYPNTELNVTYTYDENTDGQNGIGRLTTVSGQGVTYRYSYTQEGQISRVDTTHQYLSNTSNTTTMYEYSQGLLSVLTYPSGAQVGYLYEQGDVTSVTLNYSDEMGQLREIVLASNIEYQPFGPMKSLTYGNGKQLIAAFSEDGALKRKQITGIVDNHYTVDALNRITNISDGIGGESEYYSYDDLDRLVAALGAYGDIRYEYDTVGNRKSKTTDGVKVRYSYSTNKLGNQNGNTYGYDKIGNLISRNSDVFSYNDANRLTSASVNTGVYRYLYNYIGQRVIKRSDTTIRHYHYDIDGMLLSERDSDGNTLVEYVYINGQRLAILAADALYYVHTNHLDAPLALTDENGSLVWQTRYTPFGKSTISINLLPQAFTSRFPGQYADEESGFYYNYFRDYDPELGRYIQSDPIGLAGGINTYAYVGGNPIMYVDPEGLLSFNFDQFANQIRDNRSSTASSLAALSSTFTFGTLPKAPSELRGLGVSKQKLNPYTSQLSRWNGRLNRYTGIRTRALRDLGRSRVGIVGGTMATAGLIFDGFYNWGVILKAAYDATSFDDSDENMLIETCN